MTARVFITLVYGSTYRRQLYWRVWRVKRAAESLYLDNIEISLQGQNARKPSNGAAFRVFKGVPFWAFFVSRIARAIIPLLLPSLCAGVAASLLSSISPTDGSRRPWYGTH